MKVKCPTCQTLKDVEPSTDGIVSCPDCGQKMRIKADTGPGNNIQPESAVSEKTASGTPVRGGSRRRALKTSRRRNARARAARDEEEDLGALDKLERMKKKKMNEKNAIMLVVSAVLLLIVFIVAMSMHTDKALEEASQRPKKPTDRGIPTLTKMVQEDPTNRNLREELAGLLLSTGDYAGAWEHYDMLVDQENIRIYNRAVECLLKLGKYEEADMYYKRAQKFAPNELNTIEQLIADDIRRRGLEMSQALEIDGMREALEKLKQAEDMTKNFPNDNEKRKEATRILEECLKVFEMGQKKFPLNRLIDGRIVKANRVLMWTRKFTIEESVPVKPAVKDTAPKEVDKSL